MVDESEFDGPSDFDRPPKIEEEMRLHQPEHRNRPDYHRASLQVPGALGGAGHQLTDHLEFWLPGDVPEKDEGKYEVARQTSQALTGGDEEKQETLREFSSTITETRSLEETLELAERASAMVEEAIPGLPDNSRLYDNPKIAGSDGIRRARALALAGIIHAIPQATGIAEPGEEDFGFKRARKEMNEGLQVDTASPVLVNAYEIASRIAEQFPDTQILEDVVSAQFEEQ